MRECLEIRVARLARVGPGLGEKIHPRANRASVKVVKFKRLLMYFPFMAWKDSFADVDLVSGSSF
jgi:hypothetical protein